MTRRRRSAAGLSVVALAALASVWVACARDELVDVDPKESPGNSAPTLESILGPGDVGRWIDTVFFGFSGPSGSTFMLVDEGSAELTGRGLVRFLAPIDDSVFVFDTLSGALRIDSLRLILSVDTARSQLASGGTTLQVRAVDDAWDAGSASWELAVDSPGVSMPWTAGPGGSFGDLLSQVTVSLDTLDLQPDSIVFDLSQYSDSLIRAWNDTTRENKGLGVVVADSGRLVLGIPRLQYNIIPELFPDTTVEIRCPGLTSVTFCFPSKTYIFDRAALPPAVGVLRVGGVDGWRAFTEVVVPDSVKVIGSSERRLIRRSTVSKAELLLSSLQTLGPPLWAEGTFDGTVIRLNDDFTILGPKTPVGNEVSTAVFTIDVDSLQAGSTVAIDITRLIQDWAAVPIDSAAPPIRFVIRARPEGTTFGYWEFGGSDGTPQFAPFLRIVFTPNTEFAFP